MQDTYNEPDQTNKVQEIYSFTGCGGWWLLWLQNKNVLESVNSSWKWMKITKPNRNPNKNPLSTNTWQLQEPTEIPRCSSCMRAVCTAEGAVATLWAARGCKGKIHPNSWICMAEFGTVKSQTDVFPSRRPLSRLVSVLSSPHWDIVTWLILFCTFLYWIQGNLLLTPLYLYLWSIFWLFVFYFIIYLLSLLFIDSIFLFIVFLNVVLMHFFTRHLNITYNLYLLYNWSCHMTD